MKTRQQYISPGIDIISLDNEISLALSSNPPVGPDETGHSELNTPDFLRANPTNTTNC
jgi:hypothetical protein